MSESLSLEGGSENTMLIREHNKAKVSLESVRAAEVVNWRDIVEEIIDTC